MPRRAVTAGGWLCVAQLISDAAQIAPQVSRIYSGYTAVGDGGKAD
jgi:hypothetical protein